MKREIRSNLVPRRGKNARLVSLLGNVERSILLIDTIEFFEVVPSYWSRTNNPASFFFFFFFLPRQIRTSTSTLVGRGLAGISYGFALVVRGHPAFEQQRRGDGLLGLRRRVLPRKNNRVPRAENLARLNRRELPPSANLLSLSTPLFPDGFFLRDVLTIEIARGRGHGSFLRAVSSFQKNLFPPSFQFLLSSLASFFPCLGTERTVVPCRRG